MPQSARPERTACAMSGPVGQARLHQLQIIGGDAGARQQREQQQLRAGAGGPLRHPRARRRD